MQLQDLDVLKEIPGYTVILKAVLKSQIQMLVEQLSEQTGEESVILTASVNDCTLCHLGSNRGKDFLDGREELKSQFLKHCLNTESNKRFTEETEDSVRPAKIGRYGPESVGSSTFSPPNSALSVRQNVHTLSSHTEPSYQTSGLTSHSEPSFKTAESTGHFRKKPAFVSKKKSSTFTSKPSTVTSDFQNIPISPTNHSTPVTKVTNLENERDVIAVKLELPSGDQSSVLVSLNKDIEHGHLEAVESTTSNKVLQLETSSHITDVSDKTSENENNKTQVFDSSEIKVEPANEEDLDLEITGVEMAAEDMGDNTNWTAGSGFGSSTSDFQSEAVDTGVQTGAYNQTMDEKSLMESYACRHAGNQLPTELYDVAHQQLGVARKKFPCTVCPKVFFIKQHFQNHLRIHTGEKPYSCRVCNSHFRQEIHLHTHERKFHPDICRKFVCAVCGEKFLIRRELKRHQNELQHHRMLFNP